MADLMAVPRTNYLLGHTSDGLFAVRVTDAAFRAESTGPVDADAWFKAWLDGNTGVAVWLEDTVRSRVRVHQAPSFGSQECWKIERLVDAFADEWEPLSPQTFPTRQDAYKHLVRLRRQGRL